VPAPSLVQVCIFRFSFSFSILFFLLSFTLPPLSLCPFLDNFSSPLFFLGKTAAFLIPILERLLFRPKDVAMSRVLILTPTRELAIQCHSVATKLARFTDIHFCLVVGGLNMKIQQADLRRRADVLIATPGRLIDHLSNSPSFDLDSIEILVLDEADRQALLSLFSLSSPQLISLSSESQQNARGGVQGGTDRDCEELPSRQADHAVLRFDDR